jgi:hypothetical protein
MTVQAISTAHTNGELVAQVASLHAPDPARETWRVLDLTPGRGKMWTHWHPVDLTETDHNYHTHYPPSFGLFDLILFDPPYSAKGGKATVASIAEHDDRYGRSGRGTHPDGRKTGITPGEVFAGLTFGMRSLDRLLAPGGQLWVKSADFVTGGRVHWGNHLVRDEGRALGLTQVDEFIFKSKSPQLEGRVQRHARRGFSTLTVWRKP